MKLSDILSCGLIIIVVLAFAVGMIIICIQDDAQLRIDCMDIGKTHNLETRITGGKCQTNLCGVWIDTYDVADFEDAVNNCK